jgi:uncharacterized protein involved in outer membrane biogenesis
MKKKIIAGVAAIVVIVIVVAVFYLLSNLNSLVAGAIEKYGSDVTDTRVGVSGVDISLREGRGSISGLTVANPEGFEASNAFSLADITVDIDLKSVREDPVVIDEIRIRAPVVNAEITESGASNIDELRKQVQAYTAGASGGGDSDGSGGEKKNIRIKQFVFEQGRVEVDASALGVEKRTITLPEIRLTDVGGTSGAVPDKIAKVILTTVTNKVMSEIADSEVDRLIKDQLGDSAADKAKGLLDKIGD